MVLMTQERPAQQVRRTIAHDSDTTVVQYGLLPCACAAALAAVSEDGATNR